MVNDLLFNKFKEKAESVNAEVYRFKDKHEAIKFILAFLEEGNFKSSDFNWLNNSFLNDSDKRYISEKFPGINFEVSLQSATQAKVGISEIEWAIANSGTLVHDATSFDSRIISMLPEVHIAIVSTSKLLEDLASLLNRFHPQKAHYLAFITGPSRTADIERVLTIGVHGPERLIIVFVDDMGC